MQNTYRAGQEETATDSIQPQAAAWTLPALEPSPMEEWDRMRRFVALDPAERGAMLKSIPPLFRRGHELVIANYDYLLANPDTAQALGWEGGADAEHLDERRRFFTIWLARLLGMDYSHDLAAYLFKAGKMHAGYGPRRAHIHSAYVTGAISLMTAAFARTLNEEAPGEDWIPAALAGWGKTLSMHLHMMLLGYESARRLGEGEFSVSVTFYGRMRAITGATEIAAGAYPGSPVTTLLKKVFEFFPQARDEALEVTWTPGEHVDAFGNPWMTVNRAYLPRRGWRVLLNGRDIAYLDETHRALHPGNTVQLFPPGR